MRSSLTWLASLAFVVACADAPMAPSLVQPPIASFDEEDDDPPPPWQRVEGFIITETGTVSYSANFLATPKDNVAWLNFVGGTFSANARIMSVNGSVKGTGTFTAGGATYNLNTVTSFSYDGDCTNTLSETRVGCASFAGQGFSSAGSATWSGFGAGTGIRKPGGGGGGGGGEVCTIACFDTGIKGR